jgi:hypothetical protein
VFAEEEGRSEVAALLKECVCCLRGKSFSAPFSVHMLPDFLSGVGGGLALLCMV